MAPALATTWDVTTAAGQSPSVVRLRNLQSTTHIGMDGWSRRHRPQPLLVSATVSLERPSAASSASDSVDTDTVHYGLLSKAILSELDEVDDVVKSSSDDQRITLRRALDLLWVRLTGHHLDGAPAEGSQEPFLDLRAVRCLSITFQLPKASLVGGRVSLTGTSVYRNGETSLYGLCQELSGIQVPTLIGINANERGAKQVLITDVEIDCFDVHGDIYPCLELAVYETIAESCFGTLEALAASLAESIRAEANGKKRSVGLVASPDDWRIKIKLEKPVAVPLAEGAGIEFISTPVNSRP